MCHAAFGMVLDRSSPLPVESTYHTELAHHISTSAHDNGYTLSLPWMFSTLYPDDWSEHGAGECHFGQTIGHKRDIWKIDY
jgi:hypothetical protein